MYICTLNKYIYLYITENLKTSVVKVPMNELLI